MTDDRSMQQTDDADSGSTPAQGQPSGAVAGLEDSDPLRRGGEFVPAVLDKTVIAVPLLHALHEEAQKRKSEPNRKPELYDIIIDLNNEYRGGDAQALAGATTGETVKRDGQAQQRKYIGGLIDKAIGAIRGAADRNRIDWDKSNLSDQYMFATLEGAVIRELVRLDNEEGKPAQIDRPEALTHHRAIYSIWPDFDVQPLLTKSHITVKADAAWVAFSAFGENIVWAVLDSGIDKRHPHFQLHKNLELPGPLEGAHHDFTSSDGDPLSDEFGHGTHVAGILAGEKEAPKPEEVPAAQPAAEAPKPKGPAIRAYVSHRDEHGDVKQVMTPLPKIAGLAPKCKLVSLKVLNAQGADQNLKAKGKVSNLILAIEHIQRFNNYGRRLRIHGVNMSIGYGYEPEWFACGQSPICVEVDRLVRSGVVVVVAAGNTGYGWLQAAFKTTPVAAGMDLSINDPGNAELAITVGSTHRERPHVYGVSYFSSKGPTGDGRLKPDLVAPGEKILSCAAGRKLEKVKEQPGAAAYVEDSGTSMAAPHVSGAIAAFLSVRPEFIGQPEKVKQIFLSTATDLRRDRHFQGHGLVDLMRAIQSV